MGKRQQVPDLPNSEISHIIDEWIHSEVERQILKRYLIDSASIERISEEIDRSPRQTARLLKHAKEAFFEHV